MLEEGLYFASHMHGVQGFFAEQSSNLALRDTITTFVVGVTTPRAGLYACSAASVVLPVQTP